MCSALALAFVAGLVLACPGTPTAVAAPAPGPALAQAGTPAPQPVKFEGIRIFPAEKRIEVDAQFQIVDDAYFLEYLAVAPYGKLHESLFELKCDPEKLQLGLILCGLQEKPEVNYVGEARELTAPTRVAIEAEWRGPAGAAGTSENDLTKRMRVEDLLSDVRLGREMEKCGFAFTGSRFIEAWDPKARGQRKVFAATSSGSAIALYHDPDAILDNPLVTGGDVPLLTPTFRMVEVVSWIAGDERLKPATGKCPPHGTRAVLHLRPLAP